MCLCSVCCCAIDKWYLLMVVTLIFTFEESDGVSNRSATNYVAYHSTPDENANAPADERLLFRDMAHVDEARRAQDVHQLRRVPGSMGING